VSGTKKQLGCEEATITDRDEVVAGYTKKVPFACGNLYITVNTLDGMPYRVFLKLGKTGICQRALLESIARLVTIMLQEQVSSLERICKTLIGMACDKGMVGRQSCVHVLAEELKTFLPEKEDDD